MIGAGMLLNRTVKQALFAASKFTPQYKNLNASLMKNFFTYLVGALVLVLPGLTAQAQYTEDFNSLAQTGDANPWTDNATLPGWYWVTESAFARTYRANDGASNTGALYSYGATSANERALGSLASGSPDDFAYALVLLNNSGSPITDPQVSYTGEQWRNGANSDADVLEFSYGVFASVPTLTATSAQTGFTSLPALNFSTPIFGGTAGKLDGNAPANRQALNATLSGVTIPAGEYLVLKFYDNDDGGSDHGIGVDDLSVSGTGWVVPPPPTPTVTLASTLFQVSEGVGTFTVTFNIDIAPSVESTVDVALTDDAALIALDGISSASVPGDISLASAQVVFPAGSTASQEITVTVVDDGAEEIIAVTKLVVSNPAGNVQLGTSTEAWIFLQDNDQTVPSPANELNISFAGRYRNNVDASGTPIVGDPGPAEDGGTYTSEIVAFDPLTNRLFVANGTTQLVNVLEVDENLNVTQVGAIDFSGVGAPNSVAVSSQGVLAIVCEDGTDKTLSGRVYIYKTDLSNFTLGGSLGFRSPGALPDMVTFSKDGSRLFIAAEGEPNDYTTTGTDPLGEVTAFEVPADVVANPPSSWNGITIRPGSYITDMSAFVAGGGRFYGAYGSVPGLPVDNVPNAEEDMEPEYIAVSDDGNFAYITLQENNALCIIDYTDFGNPDVTVLPLGVFPVDEAGGLDASNDGSVTEAFIGTWPVVGQPMPDAIAYANIGGTGYLFTANEGDAREYDGLLGGTAEEADDERFRDYTRDATNLPDDPYSILVQRPLLGQLRMDRLGDTDLDGDLDELRTFGTRSFTIWNAATGAPVWDSENLFELITANDPRTADIFNANNDDADKKARSDDKGPEPEAITVAKINDHWYAFIALERVGGVMVFNVDDPAAPVFDQYLLDNRPTTFDLNADDLGPEDLKYIRPEDSPNDRGLLVVANEISGTIQFYTMPDVLNAEPVQPGKALGGIEVYPNPVADYLHLKGQAPVGNLSITVDLYDLKGSRYKTVAVKPAGDGSVDASIYVGDLKAGLYVVNLQQGGRASSVRIVKQ